MNKTLVKKAAMAVVALAVVVVSMSSCSRGYGCPYKFEAKAQTTVQK